jgi:hypothetical protein
MKFAGELQCLFCGYIAGDIDGDSNKPFSAARITQARNGPGVTQRAGERPRCGRCNGQLHLQSRDVVFRVAARDPERVPQAPLLDDYDEVPISA